jgi:hypothetical protein
LALVELANIFVSNLCTYLVTDTIPQFRKFGQEKMKAKLKCVQFCAGLQLRPLTRDCQMVYFETKNSNLGKFWRVLQWKMLAYFVAIWFWSILWPFGIFCCHLYMLWPFGIFCGYLVYFVVICYICGRLVYFWPLGTFLARFGMLHQGKSGNPPPWALPLVTLV